MKRQERPQTQQNLNESFYDNNINVIRETRQLIKGMTEQQRFKKALKHVKDALAYKQPRPDAFSTDLAPLFRFAYVVQTSKYWSFLLVICSYLYMYTILIDAQESFALKITAELSVMAIFWVDIAMYLYHKSFQQIRVSSKFEIRFYIKVLVIFLLSIDIVVFVSTEASTHRIIRPFRILRAFLPIFYDPITRKSFEALVAAYKDILVYVMLYAMVIVSFGLVAHQFIQLPPGTEFDELSENYVELGKAIFVIYVLSSYDSYPDNQLVAIRWSVYVYGFFVLFILLNVFFFVTIPTTIIFNSFRETRSKIILIDEIRQQHSLILAFVSLGEDDYNIETNVLVRFLLYMYKYKVRYVSQVAEICLRLDENNNGSIQISEFMQLCKIITQNSHMKPPEFDDWQWWLDLRSALLERWDLERFVRAWGFKFCSNLVIVLTFCNSIAYVATEAAVFFVFDNVFMALFVVEIVLKILGLGLESFFRDKWNHLDFFLVVAILVCECFPDDSLPRNSDYLIKMTRIFRITTLIKLISPETDEYHLIEDTSVYGKIKQLLGQTAIILPIVIKFFPFFLISCYFLGVVGMEVFYYAEAVPPTQQYGAYQEHSNFQTFLGTHLIFVQILVEAGWSMLAFDYAKRTNAYLPVMLYFVACHVIIVLILSSLLKGLVWEAYFTVDEEFHEQMLREASAHRKERRNRVKKEEFDEIKAIIEENGFIIPNSMIKREFLENKLDLEIFKHLKELYAKASYKDRRSRRKRSQIIEEIVLNKRKYIVDEMDSSDNSSSDSMNELYNRIIRRNVAEGDLQEIEEEDFEEEMEELMNKLILHPKMKFTETIIYPKTLAELLALKMERPLDRQAPNQKFDVDRDPIENKESIQFHMYELNVLLEIEKSERDQKMLILKNMTEQSVISEEEAKKIFSTSVFTRNYHIDVNWVIRRMFLHETNEDLIKKFEIEYFSDIYGQSFKEINKVTIEPLLRYEALLTYNLRNLLRYPQLSSQGFFQMLSKIEDCISHKLLKKGSLFKFVYQIEAFSDNWFTVEFKDSEDVKVHFIKTGIWIFDKTMREQEIYYARDLFNWDVASRPDRITCEKILKLLFQTFEGLAFGLLNEKYFFRGNPVESIYDLYCFFLDVSKLQRFFDRKLEISRVMLVVLSKEEERPPGEHLEYELSEIVSDKRMKKDLDFKFDESERETYNKLKKLSVLDHEKIVESEGLPFAYILNLMKEVSEILKLNAVTLVNQVEKVFNEEFENN